MSIIRFAGRLAWFGVLMLAFMGIGLLLWPAMAWDYAARTPKPDHADRLALWWIRLVSDAH